MYTYIPDANNLCFVDIPFTLKALDTQKFIQQMIQHQPNPTLHDLIRALQMPH